MFIVDLYTFCDFNGVIVLIESCKPNLERVPSVKLFCVYAASTPAEKPTRANDFTSPLRMLLFKSYKLLSCS